MHWGTVNRSGVRAVGAWWLLATCSLAALWSCGPARVVRAADEGPSEDQLQLIVEFLSDADRETRAIGLQYVREPDQVPGEAATKRFVELLPKLKPDAQAELIEALGERGDPAARPAMLELVKSSEAEVRAAALGALGRLGTAAEVPLLAEKAAAGSDVERAAARRSLAHLRGDDVNDAIVAALKKADAEMRAELIGVLAARNANEAVPAILELASDNAPAVRLAVLKALRYLADASHVPQIVDILKAAGDGAERRQAELTLLVTCSRAREQCADALIVGLDHSDPASRIVLVRALARAGGPKALEAIRARLKDEDSTVRDEAVRMLAAWSDAAVVPDLKQLAADTKNLRHHVLAIRGLVRLARARGDKGADVELLAETMTQATRPEEKRLVLGALATADAPEALALAVAALDDAPLVEEAAIAAVMIAEKLKGESNKAAIRAAMDKVLAKTKNDLTRARAKKVLASL